MYLLALTVHIALSIYLLDVVTSYLHGTLDSILNINPPPGLGSIGFNSKIINLH